MNHLGRPLTEVLSYPINGSRGDGTHIRLPSWIVLILSLQTLRNLCIKMIPDLENY